MESAIDSRRSKIAFTLVELLVVITIIVVLLALLTPGLDQAIYQAELAVDAAKIRSIANKVNMYALDFKRNYPYRKAVRDAEGPVDRAPMDFNRHGKDDRAVYEGYFDLNADFNDPFVEPVDIENSAPESWISGTYAMWFGYAYNHNRVLEKGMFKLGDRFEYKGRSFNWLVTDHDVVGSGAGGAASHPDRDGVASQVVIQDSAGGDENDKRALVAAGFKYTFSRWEALAPGSIIGNFALNTAGQPTEGPGFRGVLDLSYGAADESVLRMNYVPAVRVPEGDEPVVHVPMHADGAAFPQVNVQLPR